MRREVWLFQMNDEQRSMAFFQGQPEGPGLFFHPAALLFAHVNQLHSAHSALLGKKTVSGSAVWLIENAPQVLRQKIEWQNFTLITLR